MKTSVYLRSSDVIASSYDYHINPIWGSISQWFVAKFAPAVPPNALSDLDAEAELAVATLADALEQHDVSRARSILEPELYSLFLDNFLRFDRVHKYRLSVSDIRCKRVAVRTTIKLPSFAKETLSGLALWPGINFIYSQPADPKPVAYARKLMAQTVGHNLVQLRQQEMIAETPLYGSLVNAEMIKDDADTFGMGGQPVLVKQALEQGYNPFKENPIPERLLDPRALKRRLLSYMVTPFIGDLVSFLKYLSAMRRAGFLHVLMNTRVEFEVVYGCEAKHNVSVIPIADPIPEPEQVTETRTEREKVRARFDELLKHPHFEKRSAPHLFILRGSYALHPDAEQVLGDPIFTGWRLSEFDGLRKTEAAVLGRLAKLSAKSVKDIDASLPALRLFSKDLFTIHGPKPEWFEERKRLVRVARNREETRSIEDPLEELAQLREQYRIGNHKGKSPVEIMLAHGNDMIPQSRAKNPTMPGSVQPGRRNSFSPEANASSKPLGNIFDLAREQNNPKL